MCFVFLTRASLFVVLLVFVFLCITWSFLGCQNQCNYKWLPGKTRQKNDLLFLFFNYFFSFYYIMVNKESHLSVERNHCLTASIYRYQMSLLRVRQQYGLLCRICTLTTTSQLTWRVQRNFKKVPRNDCNNDQQPKCNMAAHIGNSCICWDIIWGQVCLGQMRRKSVTCVRRRNKLTTSNYHCSHKQLTQRILIQRPAETLLTNVLWVLKAATHSCISQMFSE